LIYVQEAFYMNKNKFIHRLGLTLVLAVLLTLVVGVHAQEPIVFRGELASTDIPTLDPALATDETSIQIIQETYVGLTRQDEETLVTEPGMASSWDSTVNDDGTVTHVFTLMENIPWVQYDPDSDSIVEVTDADGNVRYVTANDFVYGWKRTLDPATAGEYAYVLSPQVVGGDLFNTGGGTADDVMITATGDYTLEVVAPVEFSPQLAIYGLWMALPQPQWAIEEFGDFWIESENFQSFGPFAVKEWLHDEAITLLKNPFWPGIDSVPQASFDVVELYIIDESVALAQYEAGDLDYVDHVPASDMDRLKSDPVLSTELSIIPAGNTAYYGFDTRESSATANVNLRRAFSFAVDRQSLVDNVTRGNQIPAQWFSAPALDAAPTLESHPDLGVWYDGDMARDFLATALEEMGLASVDELPTISLLFNTSETNQRIAEAIQGMWIEELGIEVQLTSQEFAVYLNERENFPIWRAGWGADYFDAANFIGDVFKSTSQNNDTWFVSEEMDSLIDQAALLTDPEERRELYAQAEQILVYEGAAIIPLYWGTEIGLVKSNINRGFSRTSTERLHKWSFQ
jgi:oligopeptide transport system substrate-binding protein